MRITPWNIVSISGVLANSSASQEILFSIKTYFSSPSKGIQPVHPKGNQSWIFTGRTDAEAETLILWPPDEKNWLIGKDPDAGKKLKVGEVDHRGWDGWMASLTQWTWVWVSSGSWWWTGRPGVHPCMEAPCIHGVAKSWTRLSNWTELIIRNNAVTSLNKENWHCPSVTLMTCFFYLTLGSRIPTIGETVAVEICNSKYWWCKSL